jgi:hypothetical protein
VVQNFVRVPLLLHLSHVTDGCKSSNILGLITTALMGEGGMSREEVAAKLVSCSFDGASILQGTKTRMTTALQQGNGFSMVANLEVLM